MNMIECVNLKKIFETSRGSVPVVDLSLIHI